MITTLLIVGWVLAVLVTLCQRTCPICCKILYKENHDDLWVCDSCGWIE